MVSAQCSCGIPAPPDPAGYSDEEMARVVKVAVAIDALPITDASRAKARTLTQLVLAGAAIAPDDLRWLFALDLAPARPDRSRASNRRPGYAVRAAAAAIAIAAAWALAYSQLQPFAGWLTYSLFSLPPGSRLSSAVEFFAYESPKVLMLLLLIVFVVGVIRTYVTPERVRRILSGRRESAGNVLAATLGIVTPFCSCSAVPLFIGFVRSGVPLGVTLSFLIAAPMINEVAVVLLFGLFGWKVALLYVTTGLVVAIGAGWIIGRLRMERHVEAWIYDAEPASLQASESPRFSERLNMGGDAVADIVGRVWPWVLLGIAVGAGIHGYVPVGTMADIMGADTWWSVPAAVLLGVPMYSNAAGIIPIVQALLEKGASLGTSLAFMMAVIGLSLPEVIILRKVLRPMLIGVFVGVVAAGILCVGYLFNAIL